MVLPEKVALLTADEQKDIEDTMKIRYGKSIMIRYHETKFHCKAKHSGMYAMYIAQQLLNNGQYIFVDDDFILETTAAAMKGKFCEFLSFIQAT